MRPLLHPPLIIFANRVQFELFYPYLGRASWYKSRGGRLEESISGDWQTVLKQEHIHFPDPFCLLWCLQEAASPILDLGTGPWVSLGRKRAKEICTGLSEGMCAELEDCDREERKGLRSASFYKKGFNCKCQCTSKAFCIQLMIVLAI